jgi:hypothetical protein
MCASCTPQQNQRCGILGTGEAARELNPIEKRRFSMSDVERYRENTPEAAAYWREVTKGRVSMHWLIFPTIMGAVTAAGIAPILIPSRGYTEKEQACDRVVATLLNSKELVEVQRAGILMREIGCYMGNRLPKE